MTAAYYEQILHAVCAITGAAVEDVKSKKVQPLLTYTRYIYCVTAKQSSQATVWETIAAVINRSEQSAREYACAAGTNSGYKFWVLKEKVRVAFEKQKTQYV